MIIVTGDPRSGTSLTMQMIKELGVEVLGEKFPQEKQEGEMKDYELARLELSRNKNPGGFYEIPRVVIHGFSKREDFSFFKGKAVKVICPSSLPPRTPKEHVEKYIFCVRDPKSVSVSQSGLLDASITVGDGEDLNPSAKRYILDVGSMINYLKENLDDRWLFINYDETIENPQKTAQAICDHIGGDQSKVLKAASLVKKKLKRSDKKFKGWINENEGRLAEDVFNSLLDHSLMDVVACDVVSYFKSEELESVKWWSPDYGRFIVPSLERSIKNNPELSKKLKDSVCQRTADGHYPEVAEAEETYTIKRPDDLGDLVRNKVVYEGEVMTWEAAVKKHQVKRFRS